MSERQAWPGQPYLDALRPEHASVVKLALFTTYSLDISAVTATLLALIGRNNDKGSGTAADFAEAIDAMRDKVRILIQRGRIARPLRLPKIAGILDQFIVEQDHDEATRSWHPKIALVAYEGPKERRSWKLWVGSRNLTRSRDLDVGILIEGTPRRSKGKSKLRGIGRLGRKLAEDARIGVAESIEAELEDLWWEAPLGYSLLALLNGLDDGVALPMKPPEGKLAAVTIVSPFLCPIFLKMAGQWGPDDARTIVSTMPTLVDMANRPGHPLRGFSKIFAYEAPDLSLEELPEEPTASGSEQDDSEPVPPSLHAKLFCFEIGAQSIVRVGSANATNRAWSGRNAEVMVEFIGGDEFKRGLGFLVGSAKPVKIDALEATLPSERSATDVLEESRQKLVAEWDPQLLREGECFTLVLKQAPWLLHKEHTLEAGLANGDLLPWPKDNTRLGFGQVPLSHQSAFIQVRISGPDGNLSWIQCVPVTPPLDGRRDLAALARHLGPRAFYDWMRAMLSGDQLPAGDNNWDDVPSQSKLQREGITYERLTLEDILMAWARDKNAFARTDRHFGPYVDAILAHGQDLAEAEKTNLRELAEIWAMARERLTP
jgi:hypothetical protein